MKIKMLVALMGLICFSACSQSLEDRIADKNEISEQRSDWAQFEEKRTEQELSIFQ